MLRQGQTAGQLELARVAISWSTLDEMAQEQMLSGTWLSERSSEVFVTVESAGELDLVTLERAMVKFPKE